MSCAGVDEPRYLFGGWIAARVAMAMFAGVAAAHTYLLAVRRYAVSSPTTSLVTAADTHVIEDYVPGLAQNDERSGQ